MVKLRNFSAHRKLRHGGAFGFFGTLMTIGSFIQKGIDTIAPLTSKLVGPVSTALTGVAIPNPSDVLQGKVSMADIKPTLMTIAAKRRQE